MKLLASLKEMGLPSYVDFMRRLNEFARTNGLQEYYTYSRLWEYPWTWSVLEPFKNRHLKLLDIGSELSPFPWFLATQGFQVTIADLTPSNFGRWRAVRRRIGAPLCMCVLDAQRLDLPTASLDIYESLSVIEHVSEKARAIAEAARVLKPGGLLVITFDICEPDQGMSFPVWNGAALSMREFDELFQDSAWFEPGIPQLPWNTDAISEYLTWHRTTAPHHNYVTGAAVLRRNARVWQDSPQENRRRILRKHWRTVSSVASWNLRTAPGAMRRAAVRPIKGAVKAGQQLVTSAATARLVGKTLYRLAGRAAKEEKIELARMRRVLVLRLDEIGDVVMTSAFLRELRRNLPPDSEVTLVVKPTTQNLVEHCPYINEVLTFDWSARGRFAPIRLHGRALRFAEQHLWQRRFDLAILPRWDADYYHASFLAYFSGANCRAAFSEMVNPHKQRLNRDYDRLFTHIIADAAEKHEVEHNLDVLRWLGGTVRDSRLEVWPAAEDHALAEHLLAERGLRDAPFLVGLGPSGGNSALKQWPAQKFVTLGRELRSELNARFLIFGGPGEEALGREIAHGVGEAACDLTARTTLREMAALLERCALFVGNDAGPMHIAAAAGTPVVAVFGSSCTHRFRPWGKPHVVVSRELPCRPCAQPEHRDRCERCIYEAPLCLHDLSVDDVLQAVHSILARQARAAVKTSS